MRRVNQEINKTQKLLQLTCKELEGYARKIDIDEEFERLLAKDLGYLSALDGDHSLICF